MASQSGAFMHQGDGFQHNVSSEEATRHEEGKSKQGAHVNDDKDERSIANRLESASRLDKEERQAEKEPKPAPTAAARSHGNEPSRGAKMDEELEREEAELLKKKDGK